MKVLILANYSVGLYIFRMHLINALLENNEVVISCPNTGFWEELSATACKLIDTSIDRRGINPVVDYKLYREYKSILKKEKPDLVITYTIKPNIYGGYACRKLGIPYAVNITGLGTAFQGNGVLKKIVTTMYRVSCKKAKVVFFENEENRQIFIKENIVPREITKRLDGAGVDLDKFQLAEYPNRDTIRFLFMGRVMQEKGVDELFSAMKKLLNDGVNCELSVLGSYEENYERVVEQYQKEGWLHYYGYQKDVYPYIKECDCFVLPSWHEGMANTNLESAATGRPVITSNIHGCLEAIEDGVSGYLCESKNVDSLYAVMKKFCCLPYEARKLMGLNGRKRMEKIFDKKKVVSDTMDSLF